MDDELAFLTERARARVGTSLRGKYLLERLLGIGGAAAVFESSHRNGMRTAVKVLHKEVATIPEVRRRFLREGYIANKIDHPGVVRVLDDDEDVDGTAFVVMELLEGRTLEAELVANGGRLPLPRVLAVIDELLDVLDAAHANGVVHRDLKPDNMFITRDGRLKVLDFGIARLVDASSTTRSGQMMGTPQFVAPEQAAGKVREIDQRSDLFSVGAIMFTLLSGAYAHVARTALEYMVYAATTPARSITKVIPDLAEDIAHVIDVALSFEREGRWASASAMRAALRSAGQGAGVIVPFSPQAQPSSQREPAPISAVAISSTATIPHGSASHPEPKKP